jgi:tetratricopeptide (TPR) repeat protein
MEQQLDINCEGGRVDRLSRDSLTSLVAAIKNDDDRSSAWNVVEILEVLIDGGHFKIARSVARRVVKIVGGDGRERLFRGYEVLCDLMCEGHQSEALASLEGLYIEINSSGHSQADRVRIALLLSRALALCVGVGSLPQGAILRARHVVANELSRVADFDDHDLVCQVVVELAKSYLYAPTPDPLAARLILKDFATSERFKEVSKQRVFDLKRTLFQAERSDGEGSIKSATEEGLRQEAQSLGGVARALVELAICRGKADFDRERLKSALDIFIENEFLSGAFEAAFILASEALDRGHNVVSQRFWVQCLSVAKSGGFLHGSLLASMGSFQYAMSSGDIKLAREWCQSVADLFGSELSIGSAGLNLAAALQILNDFEGAEKVAKISRRFFKDNRMLGFQAQAAHIVGLCRARKSDWSAASKFWSEAISLDDQRYALMSAAERRALLAQADLMRDVAQGGPLRAATAKKIGVTIAAAESAVSVFASDPDAKRLEARLQWLRAHVCVVQEEHVRALRYLSDARAIFESLQTHYDVAMTDAFMALSMLAIGKAGNTSLLEEAVLNLQRALQFFAPGSGSAIRWKLLYYMAVCGAIIGQSKFADEDKIKWRELASGWLRSSEKEVEQLPESESSVDVDPEYAGFSPGLKRQAINELKNALGLDRKSRKRSEKGLKPEASAPDGYLH